MNRAGTGVSGAPRLGFFGPALGRHPGWVTTQGEVLADLFADDGATVLLSSEQIDPLRRAFDHAHDLWRWRRDIDVAMVSVFSGRAFALADETITVARRLGIPTVAWLHGGNLPEFGASHPRWTTRVLRRADVVVAPSAYLQRWAISSGVRSTVVPNVLELTDHPVREFAPLSPRLLWMRTFQELYEPAIAVETLASLRDAGIPATLTMAGQDKGLLGPTKQLARQLGVEPWISFVGFVSGPDKPDLFDRHDIFLNTNRVDNTPVSVLEAAASGLAVISTDVGGIPDLLVDETSALLVPPGHPDLMTAAVSRLLADPELAMQLRKGARIVAERSAWPKVAARWNDVWDPLLRSRATGRG